MSVRSTTPAHPFALHRASSNRPSHFSPGSTLSFLLITVGPSDEVAHSYSDNQSSLLNVRRSDYSIKDFTAFDVGDGRVLPSNGRGGYQKVHNTVGNMIDWYNVFYNQPHGIHHLPESSSQWPQTGLCQIAISGVLLQKLVLWNPATNPSSENGYMALAVLAVPENSQEWRMEMYAHFYFPIEPPLQYLAEIHRCGGLKNALILSFLALLALAFVKNEASCINIQTIVFTISFNYAHVIVGSAGSAASPTVMASDGRRSEAESASSDNGLRPLACKKLAEALMGAETVHETRVSSLFRKSSPACIICLLCPRAACPTSSGWIQKYYQALFHQFRKGIY
ncbi:hypothetical protein C8R43DRAFT_949651 [Mycena crocata]|nr:hypothetical protein C8R43DRAFT_949651 [Mycena crocata]